MAMSAFVMEGRGWERQSQRARVALRALRALPALCAHDWRVCVLADRLAAASALSRSDRRVVRLGALLHDVGKCAIPHQILRKPGSLTEQEWVVMRRHPVIGAELLAQLHVSASVVASVRHHHERWDGSGYPDGLCGEAIPLPARVIALADVYDAMLSDRPYQAARPTATAQAVIAAERGTMFDPALADQLLSLVRSRCE
jgi:putative nucleotidyltransferase with HDIG domain